MPGIDEWHIPRNFYKDTEDKRWSACPDQFDDEIFSSWFVRTVKANCADLLPLYHSLIGENIPFENIEQDISVKKRLVKKLEEFINVTSLTLNKLPLTVNKISNMSEKLNLFNVPLKFPRYCPLCLRDDPIPYFRLIWQLPFITICPKHHILLFDNCQTCHAPIYYWKTKWDQAICSCFKCQDDLRINMDFVMTLGRPDDINLQNDLLEICEKGEYQGQEIQISSFFESLYHVALTECPEFYNDIHKQRTNVKHLFKALRISFLKLYPRPKDSNASSPCVIKNQNRTKPIGTIKHAIREITEEERDIAEYRYNIIIPYIRCGKKTAEEAKRRAKEAGIGLSTFYRWIDSYKKDGMSALAPGNRFAGRPRKYPFEIESRMEELIRENAASPEPLSLIECWRHFIEILGKLGYDTAELPGRNAFRSRYIEYVNK